jgi:hypothetical protein
MMQHVGKSLDVHETVLNGDVEQLRKRTPALSRRFQRGRQLVIDRRTHTLVIAKDFFALRPVVRLIVGELAVYRIDAEGKELVKARREWFQPGKFAPEEIPVKSLEMAQVEDNPMSFGDGALVEGLGADDFEEGIASRPSF